MTLRLALWAGLTSVAASVVLMSLILAMRGLLLVRARRQSRFLAVWRPLLAECLLGMPSSVPLVPPGEASAFFSLWNYVRESIRGEAQARLNQVARQAGADRLATRLMQHGRVDERLLAIATLGSLGEKSAWPALSRIAGEEHPILSLAAAHALMQIDPEGSAGLVITAVLSRPDWPVSKIAAILKEAGPDAISRPLVHALWEADDTKAPLLLRLLKLAHYSLAAPTIRRRLCETASPEVICACLNLLEDPAELETVCTFAAHPAWAVRVQAVRALGRIGTQEVAPLLLRAMGDPEWWVRHRASEALIVVSGGSLPRQFLLQQAAPSERPAVRVRREPERLAA